MQEALLFIGVDVSKAELIVFFNDELRPHSVTNDAAGIAAWLQCIPPGSLLAMESRGRYHGLLAQLAHQAGMRVYVLNARDVHFYAKASGARAKTDGIDARLIALNRPGFRSSAERPVRPGICPNSPFGLR